MFPFPVHFFALQFVSLTFSIGSMKMWNLTQNNNTEYTWNFHLIDLSWGLASIFPLVASHTRFSAFPASSRWLPPAFAWHENWFDFKAKKFIDIRYGARASINFLFFLFHCPKTFPHFDLRPAAEIYIYIYRWEGASIIGMPIPTRIPILCSFIGQFFVCLLHLSCICFVIKQSWGFKASVCLDVRLSRNELGTTKEPNVNCKLQSLFFLFGVPWTQSQCKKNTPLNDQSDEVQKETAGGYSSVWESIQKKFILRRI